MSVGMGMLGGLIGMAENNSNIQTQEDWQVQQNIQGPSQKMLGLEMAHVNPMLAVTGGASPLMSNMPVQTQMPGNPLAGVNAQQQAAQARLTNAQAAQTEAQTTGSDTFPYIDGDASKGIDWQAYATQGGAHTQGNINAAQSAANLNNAQHTTRMIDTQADSNQSTADLNEWQNNLNQLTQQQRVQVYNYGVEQALADLNITRQQFETGKADAAIMGSKWGTFIRAAQMILGPAHSALSLGNRILGGTP